METQALSEIKTGHNLTKKAATSFLRDTRYLWLNEKLLEWGVLRSSPHILLGSKEHHATDITEWKQL